jgi:hypothetical protein
VRRGQALDHRGHLGEEVRARDRAEGFLELRHHVRGDARGGQRREPVGLGEVEKLRARRQIGEAARAQRLDAGAALLGMRVKKAPP